MGTNMFTESKVFVKKKIGISNISKKMHYKELSVFRLVWLNMCAI